MFGSPQLGTQSAFGAAQTASVNPMKDIEVASPPEDSVTAMEFSPATIPQNFLIAGSWDSSVRCWEVESSGKTVPKQMKTMGGPVLDVCWADVSCSLSPRYYFYWLLFHQFVWRRTAQKSLSHRVTNKWSAGIWVRIKWFRLHSMMHQWKHVIGSKGRTTHAWWQDRGIKHWNFGILGENWVKSSQQRENLTFGTCLNFIQISVANDVYQFARAMLLRRRWLSDGYCWHSGPRTNRLLTRKQTNRIQTKRKPTEVPTPGRVNFPW